MIIITVAHNTFSFYVFADPPPPTDSPGWFESFFLWVANVAGQLSAVLLVAASLVLVAVACSCFLLCQFELRRQRYAAWKSAPSSGYSTPTNRTVAQSHPMAEVAGDDDDDEQVGRTYVPVEDIETAHSSVEDIVPLVKRRRRRSAERRLKYELAAAAAAAEVAFGQPISSRGSSLATRLLSPIEAEAQRRRSLPTSPFLTRQRFHAESPMEMTSAGLITATQVKRALAAKSRRYRLGDFRPLGGRPAPPVSTPSTALSIKSRRLSRSLPDVASFLVQARRIYREQQALMRQQQERQRLAAAQRRQRRSRRQGPLPPHARPYATLGRAPSSVSGSTASASLTQAPQFQLNGGMTNGGHWATVGRRTPRHTSVTRLNRSLSSASPSVASRCVSRATLRASPDLIPTTSSVHSGDPELEYDSTTATWITWWPDIRRPCSPPPSCGPRPTWGRTTTT
jgi:hypothetical protein